MKEVPYNRLLKRQGHRYAIKDEQFWQLLDDLRLQAGGNWKDIAREARLSSRHFRAIRDKAYPTVSMVVMDKICTRLGFPHRLNELKWYSPKQLVEMGVWKPHSISGLIAKNKEREIERRMEKRRK